MGSGCLCLSHCPLPAPATVTGTGRHRGDARPRQCLGAAPYLGQELIRGCHSRHGARQCVGRLFARWPPASHPVLQPPAPQPERQEASWQKQGEGALGSTHPGCAFQVEKLRQSKCILKGTEGVVLGKEGVWKPPKPTHIPTHRGRADASHTGSAGQCWDGDVQRWGWQDPSLLTTPFQVPTLDGNAGTPQPALPFRPSCCSVPDWVL